MSVSHKNGDIPHIIGQNMKELREIKGLSQDELADKCGIEKRSYQRHESGEAKRGMSLSALLQITIALETTPNNLLEGTYPTGGSSERDELLNLFDNMSAGDRDLLLNMARRLAKGIVP